MVAFWARNVVAGGRCAIHGERAAIGLHRGSCAGAGERRRQKKVPTNQKAKKTYQEALNYQHRHMTEAALDAFKKADKQDGGHCLAWQKKMIKYGIELRDWKTAETAAQEAVEQAQGEKNVALAHYQFGIVLITEGLERRKDEFFAHSHDELHRALAAQPKFPGAIFADGQALAHLKQDDAAKARF